MILKETIQALQEKKEWAFNEVWYAYSTLIFTVIYKITNDINVSEELQMDTFVSIFNECTNYRGGNFKYWCLTIAKNKANMHIRKIISEKKALEKYKESEELRLIDEAINKKEEELSDYITNEIYRILEKETAEIVILHLLKKTKFKDIAKFKKQPVNTILSKYKRAIEKVRNGIKL